MRRANGDIFCTCDCVFTLYIMEPPPTITDFLRPRLIEETELQQTLRVYKIKTRQFLQNTGKHTIIEEGGFIIIDAVVSGITEKQNISNTVILLSGQKDCPLKIFTFDTNDLGLILNPNFEPLVQKIIEIKYMCDDITTMQKKVRRQDLEDELYGKSFDPTDCIDGIPVIEPEFTLLRESPIYIINKNRTN
jgi:hypothetical protein